MFCLHFKLYSVKWITENTVWNMDNREHTLKTWMIKNILWNMDYNRIQIHGIKSPIYIYTPYTHIMFIHLVIIMSKEIKMILYSPLSEPRREGKIFVWWDVHKVIFSFVETFIFQIDSQNYKIVSFLFPSLWLMLIFINRIHWHIFKCTLLFQASLARK